jgi:uncharacterized cupredoxin-like copper-binding protein
LSRLEVGRASGAAGGSDDEEGLLSMVRKGSAVAVLISLVALVTAVAAFGKADAPVPVTVTAGKPSEFHFTLNKKTAKKGATALAVSFKVTNKGAIAHDFKIAGKTTKVLAAGKSQTITVRFLKKGKYAYLCTLPGHAAGGMKGTFTVK